MSNIYIQEPPTCGKVSTLILIVYFTVNIYEENIILKSIF